MLRVNGLSKDQESDGNELSHIDMILQMLARCHWHTLDDTGYQWRSSNKRNYQRHINPLSHVIVTKSLN